MRSRNANVIKALVQGCIRLVPELLELERTIRSLEKQEAAIPVGYEGAEDVFAPCWRRVEKCARRLGVLPDARFIRERVFHPLRILADGVGETFDDTPLSVSVAVWTDDGGLYESIRVKTLSDPNVIRYPHKWRLIAGLKVRPDGSLVNK